MSDASITIKNQQFIADKVLNTTPVACTPNVPANRSNNLIQSGGNWAYERFNHSSTPSYGYGKAGAPIAHELKGNIYPALSENPSYNHCGGRKKTMKRKSKNKKKRKKIRKKTNNKSKKKLQGGFKCPICLEVTNLPTVSLYCDGNYHKFHKKCIQKHYYSQGMRGITPYCPMCRRTIQDRDVDNFNSIYPLRKDIDDPTYKYIINHLKKINELDFDRIVNIELLDEYFASAAYSLVILNREHEIKRSNLKELIQLTKKVMNRMAQRLVVNRQFHFCNHCGIMVSSLPGTPLRNCRNCNGPQYNVNFLTLPLFKNV